MKLSRKKRKKKVVVVEDLSFLIDRNHRYNWLQRHFHHHRLRHKIKHGATVIAKNDKVAYDIHRFYFVPKDSIIIKES